MLSPSLLENPDNHLSYVKTAVPMDKVKAVL